MGLMMKIGEDMLMLQISKIKNMGNNKEIVKYIIIMNNKKVNLLYLNSIVVICVQKHHKIKDIIVKNVQIMIYVVNVLFRNAILNMIMKQVIFRRSIKLSSLNLIKRMKFNKTKKMKKKHSLLIKLCKKLFLVFV